MPTFKKAVVEFAPGHIVWHPLPDPVEARFVSPKLGGPFFSSFLAAAAQVVPGLVTAFGIKVIESRSADRHRATTKRLEKLQASIDLGGAERHLCERIRRFRRTLSEGSGIDLREVQKTVEQLDLFFRVVGINREGGNEPEGFRLPVDLREDCRDLAEMFRQANRWLARFHNAAVDDDPELVLRLVGDFSYSLTPMHVPGVGNFESYLLRNEGWGERLAPDARRIFSGYWFALETPHFRPIASLRRQLGYLGEVLDETLPKIGLIDGHGDVAQHLSATSLGHRLRGGTPVVVEYPAGTGAGAIQPAAVAAPQRS